MPRGGEKRISRRAALALAAAAVLCAPGSASAATITPSTIVDDAVGGNCTLREAIQSMNDAMPNDACVYTGAFGTNDTIALMGGTTYSLDLVGSNDDNNLTGDLDPFVDVTITGNAASPPSIEDNAGDRVLDTPNPTNLTLRDLIVEDGNITDPSTSAARVGGNIRYRGQPGNTLLLDHVTVKTGTVDSDESGNNGGGIAADGGGQVTIQNGSLVSGNTVGVSTGNSFFGGGIFITGAGTDLSVTNSSVSQNKAGVSSGGVMVTTGQGGGIWDEAMNSTLIVSDSAIDMNEAGGGLANVDGLGGGIGVSSDSATITIGPNTSVSNNRAGGGFDGANGTGGGIYAGGASPSSLSLGSNAIVTGNDAGGEGGDGQGDGGGIYSEMPVSLNGASVASNDAGINGAGGSAGGIHVTNNVGASLSITNSTILNNHSATTFGVAGGILDDSPSPMTISGSRIAGNSTFASGGGVYRDPPGTPVDSISTSLISGNTGSTGAGVYGFTDGTINILRSTVTGNTAGTASGFGQGAGLDLNPATNAATSTYLIENSTIHDNTAAADGTDGGEGGGIDLHSNPASTAPVLTVRSSTISDNTATPSVGPGPGRGGNLRATDLSVTDTDQVKLQGSIVSGGTGTAGQENCSSSMTGAFQSLGGNVESTTPTQCELGGGDLTNANPMLGALQNNGGPMVGAGAGVPLTTRAITTASPAFNLVPLGLCPPSSIDEIGTTRPQGTACDAGAFEVFVAPVIPPATNPPVTNPTPTSPPAKKCKKKKKKKKKGAAAAKRCKKKKKKKRR